MHHDSSILGGQGPFSTLEELFHVYHVTIFRSLLCEPDHDWLGEVYVCAEYKRETLCFLLLQPSIAATQTLSIKKQQVLSSPKAEPKVDMNQ